VADKRENVTINYLSRDFNRIKEDLLDHAKRYYPDTFKDFSDAGFGALMVDAVSYIGDILSFYVDYQANESFLATAIEYNNIVKHGEAVGYRHQTTRSTYGVVSVYITVPANSSNTGPDTAYIPILKAGTTFSSNGGSNFTLMEDVNFNDPNNEIVVALTNANSGLPTKFAIRAQGQVVSGELRVKSFDIGKFIRFRTLSINSPFVTEIVSVTDSQGRIYYEVDHLSQNTIYIPITNTDSNSNVQAPTIIKPFIVPRRFITRRDSGAMTITFGYGSDNQLSSPSLAEARDVVLDLHSKDYVTDMAMDPTLLIKGDKFGVGPSDTKLTVIYRANNSHNSNAAAGTINRPSGLVMKFNDQATLDITKVADVRGSLEVTNGRPIQGDVSPPTTKELRELISGAHAAQNRAVTIQDYKTLVLSMPSRFGGVKRCSIVQDVDSNLRNINIYVINETPAGRLELTNSILKENLKTWLNTKRMINDSIDILDAKVVNLGITFGAIANANENKTIVFDRIVATLSSLLREKLDIGESFSITDLYTAINATTGVVDATFVKVHQKTGAGYSTTKLNVKNYTTPDGRLLAAPKNVIYEVRYPNVDIQGTVR
jgi:hypothetical protein